MEAIISATAYGGELMRHPHELGKVVPGAYADLILVNGNPLEDIGLLSHKENLDVILIVRDFCGRKDLLTNPF
jgi:imidazolonepropionase-like amidohydrolase